ncbi:MAG: cytochrome c oxidase assembly protein [Xanthobacteraceae bacterium]
MSRGSITAELLYASNPIRKPAEIGYLLLFVVAVLLWWLCKTHVSILPFWAPWDFSFVEFLSAWFAVWWYIRGLALAAPEDRPSLARRIAFFAGVAVIYCVLETRFEYYAEHQFFINRIQHVVMHHLGPLLLGLSWPGPVLWQGLPAPVRRIVSNPLLRGMVRFLQQPVLAAFLFSGSFFFWLIPGIHFRAMIDPNLFSLMNWTMVVDGILFWFLVLDPRPAPPARVSFGARAGLAFAVMFPQIFGGAIIALSSRDLYPYYNLCGRIYPQLGAGFDQAMGGLMMWIPPAMMSVVAILFILNYMRKTEGEAVDNDKADNDKDVWVVDSSSWTGL